MLPVSIVTLLVLLIVFFATLIRSALGFGEALVAVPLLALIVPLQTAAPLAVLLSITIAAIVVVQDWERVHFSSAGRLVLCTLPGIPLGLLLLASRHQRVLQTLLGALILAFCCWALAWRRVPQLHHDSNVWLFVCGLFAGILGGAYGMNGPPLVIYGSMRRWSAQQFRATLQAYFLPASILAMFGYWLANLWTPTVTRYYLLSLPVMLPAVFAGRAINRRLHGDLFMKCVYTGLAGIGALLAVEGIAGHL